MKRVIRKPPSKQTREEKLINLKAARAARGKVKKRSTPRKRKRSNNPGYKKRRKITFRVPTVEELKAGNDRLAYGA